MSALRRDRIALTAALRVAATGRMGEYRPKLGL
jgi:hypothetical protein